MGEVADREVLARDELEVAAAQAEHDGAVDAGRPHDRAAEDLAQVVEQRVAAVLGGLDDAGVAARPERDAVGPADAGRRRALTARATDVG